MPATVAIIGSAIAGPTLALQLLTHPALRRAFKPILFDAAPHPGKDIKRSAGATVGLFGNGVFPLQQLRLDVQKAGYAYRSLSVWDATGERLEKLSSLPHYMYSPSLDSGLLFCERSALQSFLAEEVVARGGDVRWGKRAMNFEPLGDGRSRVKFNDGSTLTADLLVGADGAYSAVRRHLLTMHNPASAQERWMPNYMGFTGLYGVSASPAAPDASSPYGESHAIWLHPGFIASGPCPGGVTRWDIILPAPPPETHLGRSEWTRPPGSEPWLDVLVPGRYDPAATAELVRSLARVGHPYAGNCGRLFDTADRIIHTPLHQRVWDRDEIQVAGTAGNVVLIGDAGRLLLPTSGQGTAFAVEDATVLASHLLRHVVRGAYGDGPIAADNDIDIGLGRMTFNGRVGAALEAYASERVPRGKYMAKVARIVATWGVGETWFWRLLRRLGSTWQVGGNQDKVWPNYSRYTV